MDLPIRSDEIPSINTIPDDVAAVTDLPIIDRPKKRLIIVELTAPFDTNLHSWEIRKEAKYNEHLVPI